jgi:hypothetical protein
MCTSIAGDAWTVRPDGAGPVKIGITLSQLSSVLQEKFRMPEDKEDQDCFFVGSHKHQGLFFMIEKGRLSRITVHVHGMSTTEGIQVGDSQKRVWQVYGSRVKPEKNIYLSYPSNDPILTIESEDGRFGMSFVTEGDKVRVFYAGRLDSIRHAARCR